MITTKRLHLRPIEPADREQVFRYRSDAETNQYQGWVPSTLSEVDEFIAKQTAEINTPETWFQLVMLERDSGQLIGDVGLHFIDPENFQAEMGITLDKSFHGQGYATEALSGVMEYLFNELNKHRIVTSIDPANVSSISLVERLGMRKEGHFRESLLVDGQWVDDVVYALLKSEWNNR